MLPSFFCFLFFREQLRMCFHVFRGILLVFPDPLLERIQGIEFLFRALKIQELHLPVYHALCLMLEDCFFES